MYLSTEWGNTNDNVSISMFQVSSAAKQSVSCRNSLPVSLSAAKEAAKGHKSLERRKAAGGAGLRYSGSQSTSSIPRRVTRENAERANRENLHLQDKVTTGEVVMFFKKTIIDNVIFRRPQDL